MCGVLLLLVNLEVINSDFWMDFVLFIPFLLIAIGIEKIFAQSRLKIISYLTSAVLVGAAFFVAVDGNRYSDAPGFFESSYLTLNVEDEPVETAHAVLHLGEANLTVRDASKDLFHARFDEWTYKPSSNLSVDNGLAKITIRSRSKSSKRWFFDEHIQVSTDNGGDWRVSFSKVTPLKLECDGENGDIHLNLATTPLRELNLNFSDADIYVKLGKLEPILRVTVEGYDSKLRLRLPQESGVRLIGVDDPDYLEEIGLVELDGDYVSELFGDDSVSQIEINLDDSFRSLSIDFY
jgi:hypothetical protein